MKKLIILLTVIAINLNIVNAQWQQTSFDTLNVITFTSDGTNVFAGTDGGIYLSTDNGNSWVHSGLSMAEYGVYSIVINGSNIFAATGEGVYFSNNNGSSWSVCGLAGDTVSSLIINGTNIFAGVLNQNSTTGGVSLSTDNGGSWTLPSFGASMNQRITALASNGTNIFAGTYGAGIFLSTDNGSNWTDVNNGLTNGWVFALIYKGSNLLVGAASQVFMSSDNGNSWILTSNAHTWSFYTYGTKLFAATSFGVYLSTDDGYTWNAIDNTGLSGAQSIIICGGYMYVGGFGSGIWRRPLSEIVGINENNNNVNLLYPNPTKGKFTITQTNNIKSIEVINVYGEKIYTKAPDDLKNTVEVDLSSFPKGVYIVKISNGVNTQLEKIVLN